MDVVLGRWPPRYLGKGKQNMWAVLLRTFTAGNGCPSTSHKRTVVWCPERVLLQRLTVPALRLVGPRDGVWHSDPDQLQADSKQGRCCSDDAALIFGWRESTAVAEIRIALKVSSGERVVRTLKTVSCCKPKRCLLKRKRCSTFDRGARCFVQRFTCPSGLAIQPAHPEDDVLSVDSGLCEDRGIILRCATQMLHTILSYSQSAVAFLV